MTYREVLDLMDAHGQKEHGPCALCGDPDARHRVADHIMERIAAGEPEAKVLKYYGLVTA